MWFDWLVWDRELRVLFLPSTRTRPNVNGQRSFRILLLSPELPYSHLSVRHLYHRTTIGASVASHYPFHLTKLKPHNEAYEVQRVQATRYLSRHEPILSHLIAQIRISTCPLIYLIQCLDAIPPFSFHDFSFIKGLQTNSKKEPIQHHGRFHQTCASRKGTKP